MRDAGWQRLRRHVDCWWPGRPRSGRRTASPLDGTRLFRISPPATHRPHRWPHTASRYERCFPFPPKGRQSPCRATRMVRGEKSRPWATSLRSEFPETISRGLFPAAPRSLVGGVDALVGHAPGGCPGPGEDAHPIPEQSLGARGRLALQQSPFRHPDHRRLPVAGHGGGLGAIRRRAPGSSSRGQTRFRAQGTSPW